MYRLCSFVAFALLPDKQAERTKHKILFASQHDILIMYTLPEFTGVKIQF